MVGIVGFVGSGVFCKFMDEGKVMKDDRNDGE